MGYLNKYTNKITDIQIGLTESQTKYNVNDDTNSIYIAESTDQTAERGIFEELGIKLFSTDRFVHHVCPIKTYNNQILSLNIEPSDQLLIDSTDELNLNYLSEEFDLSVKHFKTIVFLYNKLHILAEILSHRYIGNMKSSYYKSIESNKLNKINKEKNRIIPIAINGYTIVKIIIDIINKK